MAQWLDRVKFGSGKNGSPAVSGTINSYAACSGSATQTSLTTALAASAGDVILIHQSQGTGAGQWEINYVLADAGATLTLAYPLAYNYGTGAQAVLVPQYTGGTLSGAVTGTAWNGSIGGIIALMCNGDLTISGSLNISGGGFRGGPKTDDPGPTVGGEGGAGYGNRTYGGAGGWYGSSSGAGGGYGTNGANGSNALGGLAWGNTSLTNISFGGGGGGGMGNPSGNQSDGANGGGFIIIFSKTLNVSGTLSANGNTAIAAYERAGGGGAGGSILIKCQSGILGFSKLTANAGSGGYGGSTGGGNGGVGRIHIDYADSYSGSTTPTLDAAQVTSLKSQIYGGMI